MRVRQQYLLYSDPTNGALVQNGMLLGKYPVEFSEYFPSAGSSPAALTSGTPLAVLGDFSYYWIVDTSGLGVERLDERFAETSEVGFIIRAEVDAQCVNPRAFNALYVL